LAELSIIPPIVKMGKKEKICDPNREWGKGQFWLMQVLKVWVFSL
jgi:hypothetical protein